MRLFFCLDIWQQVILFCYPVSDKTFIMFGDSWGFFDFSAFTCAIRMFVHNFLCLFVHLENKKSYWKFTSFSSPREELPSLCHWSTKNPWACRSPSCNGNHKNVQIIRMSSPLVYNQTSNTEVKLNVWGDPYAGWAGIRTTRFPQKNASLPKVKVSFWHAVENSGSSSKSVFYWDSQNL